MRCLALAQHWKDGGGRATFITACRSELLKSRLVDEGFRVIVIERPHPDPADLEITRRILAAHPDAWAVLDGYHFDPTYHLQVKEAGHQLLVIDDTAHLDHYYADMVLNQNLWAEKVQYSCERTTRLLLGTRYALLRREFMKWRGWKRESPKVARRVLVTLGGGDPANQTLKVIRALRQVAADGLEAVAVVGASNPHYAELQLAIRDSQLPFRLESNVTDMPDLMAWADVAIAAAGSTCWELAFMGLPSVILVLADNQRLIADALQERGVAMNLGWFASVHETDIAGVIGEVLLDPARCESMSQRGRSVVDGYGVFRVVSELKEKSSCQKLASENGQ